ncbi:MAG: hypothetical protein PHZ09_14785, partial [Eubacteriales bacterium]|nr:hypothetical protein [Eubacteriales bacterium]
MKFAFRRRFMLIAVDILCWTAVCSVFNIITVMPGYTNVDHLLNESVLLLCIMAARLLLRVYSSIWRYAGYIEYLELVAADFLGGCVYLMLSRIIMTRYFGIWHSVAIVATTTLAVLCTRFIY